MSRFGDWDDESPITWEMVERNVWLTVLGQRMRPRLRALRDALRALPTPELVDSALSDGTRVCAVGALCVVEDARTQQVPLVDMIAHYGRLYGPDDDDDWSAYTDTVRLGQAHGLTKMLAWALANLNDEYCDRETPARRWVLFMAWLDWLLDRRLPDDVGVARRIRGWYGVDRRALDAALKAQPFAPWPGSVAA